MKKVPQPQEFTRKVQQLMIVVLFTVLFYVGYHSIQKLNLHWREVPSEGPVAPTVTRTPEQSGKTQPLLEVKLWRDRERSREMEQIQDFLAKPGLTSELRKTAENELWRMTRARATENELENLLAANGFSDCLVTIGPKQVMIMIADKIGEEQVKLIGQLASETTAYSLNKIQIVRQEDQE